MKITGFAVLCDSVPVRMELDEDIVGGLAVETPFSVFPSREDAEETAKGFIGSRMLPEARLQIVQISVEYSVDEATYVE